MYQFFLKKNHLDLVNQIYTRLLNLNNHLPIFFEKNHLDLDLSSQI